MISSPSTDRIRERAQIKVRTWLWRKHWRREDDVDSNRRSERKIKVTFLTVRDPAGSPLWHGSSWEI